MTSASGITPVVRALAGSLGVDLSSLTGTGIGGRISAADVRNAAPRPRPATNAVSAAPPRDPQTAAMFALNPLADELQASNPQLYREALQGGPAPSLFASGDLPPFTASGIDVRLLLDVPWFARPALALVESRSQALFAHSSWVADPLVAQMEAPQLSPDRGQMIADYRTRFTAWVDSVFTRREDAAFMQQVHDDNARNAARAKADAQAKAAMNKAAGHQVWF